MDKLYEIAWTWHEDYSPALFVGEAKTPEQWEADCKRAICAASDKYLSMVEENGHWAQAPDWIIAAHEELEKMGYRRVSPISFEFFGGYILEDGEFDDDDREWREIVGEKDYRRAIEHNKAVRERM